MARTVTARSLLVGVFRLLGITAQEEDPTAAEMNEGLARLNEMIDGWQTQRLTMRVTERQVFDLVSGQASYTIGPAALTPDWEADRPDFVESVALLLTNTTPHTEIPLGLLTDQAFQAIQQKTLENSLPTAVRYEPTMPTGTFTFWPVPNTAENQAVIYVPAVLAQFANLATSYTLAPGYVDALRFNLAVRIAREYGTAIGPDLKEQAAETLGAIKRLNLPMVDLSVDPGLLPVRGRYAYSILTDTP